MDAGTVGPRAAGGLKDLFRYRGVVVDRIGVRHAEDGSEPAVRGGAEARGYGFLPFITGLAQVGMHINKAREQDFSGGIHDFGVGGALMEALRDCTLPSTTSRSTESPR